MGEDRFCAGQKHQCPGNDVVERLCAETAADDKNAKRARTPGVAALRRRNRCDLRPHRVAGQACALERSGECAQDAIRDCGEHLVGEAGDRVLLVDDERFSEERRHHAAGKRDIAAHAEDHVRAMREDRTRALPESDEQPERQEKQCARPPAPHARKTDPSHVVSALGHQGRFHARLRAEPDHAPAGLAKEFGHGETGKNMASRAACHDHDGARHDGVAPLMRRLRA